MKNIRKKDNNSNQQKEIDTKISPYAWKILSLLDIIAIMVMYAETMLIPVIPDIITDLNISFGTSWILTVYLISGAVIAIYFSENSKKLQTLLDLLLVVLQAVFISFTYISKCFRLHTNATFLLQLSFICAIVTSILNNSHRMISSNYTVTVMRNVYCNHLEDFIF